MAEVSVALDWTPNTNHAGFYVAKALGLYEASGIRVELVSPHLDNYATTPAALVVSKRAAFGLAPSETVVSYHLPPYSDHRAKLVAVATCVQEDLSAIVTLKSSGINRPKGLDGKIYASYGARFEGRIVQRLIQADGGLGEYVETALEKLGIWNTLLTGQADATWIFRGWEGVQAQLEKVELNEFILADYGIPYGYTPVVVAHPDTLRDSPDLVTKFLRESAAGYEYAASSPEKAAALLIETASKENPDLPEQLDPGLVLASMQLLSKHFSSAGGRWGRMSESRWDGFLDWLSTEGLLTEKIQSRNPLPGVSASLAELREEGKAGKEIPRSVLSATDLFTNKFLSDS